MRHHETPIPDATIRNECSQLENVFIHFIVSQSVLDCKYGDSGRRQETSVVTILFDVGQLRVAVDSQTLFKSSLADPDSSELHPMCIGTI